MFGDVPSASSTSKPAAVWSLSRGPGWALSAIWRELQRVVVLSFPVAVWVTLDALLTQLGRQLEVEVDRRRHSVNTMPDPVEPEWERSEIYIG